ncbi:unnamed protein product, partial [Sphacelaria rigidula]
MQEPYSFACSLRSLSLSTDIEIIVSFAYVEMTAKSSLIPEQGRGKGREQADPPASKTFKEHEQKSKERQAKGQDRRPPREPPSSTSKNLRKDKPRGKTAPGVG